MDRFKKSISNYISFNQIGALLWKDFIIRKRQPWMTLIQFLWPCMTFLAIYLLRIKFYAYDVDECQFPTRQLPTKTDVLPFFHSYICTIGNTCISPDRYEEITTFPDAPVTPILNIVQTFINEQSLYAALVDLPKSMNFLGAVTAIATSPKFKVLEENFNIIIANLPEYHKKIGDTFDSNKIWTDRNTFSKFGTILCGTPFPTFESIPFIDQSLMATDYKGADPHELEAMPTKYCKDLYVNVASSNNGKITWNQVKPIIQGKILYGPNTDETRQIVSYANGTFEGVERLQIFIGALNTIVKRLRSDGVFSTAFQNLLTLAKSPFVSSIIKSFKIDMSMIETISHALLNDTTLSQVIQTASDMLECFSVDRFVPVESEDELEEMAFKMNDRKLFYSGIYFNTNNISSTKEFEYKIRMEIDNTPVTLENRNRFWFPGPDGDFELDMRYHRGFIVQQHNMDQAIIKYAKKAKIDKKMEEEINFITIATEPTTDVATPTLPFDIYLNGTESPNTENPTALDADVEDFLNFNDDNTTVNQSRKKRSPQFGDLLGSLLGTPSTPKKSPDELEFDVEQIHVYTKQFPYPKYRKDSFKTGIYLAQSVQMAFFFALIIQVASSVRNRIWLRESGNYVLMQIMGLKKSSEYFSWYLMSLLEICLIFLLCTCILYAEGILNTSSKFFIGYFLLLFGCGVIAFCYMASAFFASATIGSVSAVILFLITFTPYIIIIALGTSISFFVKILASFSISTPFCYAWQAILRAELQEIELTFVVAHQGSYATNDIKFGILMIFIDIILYILIGYLYERFSKDDYRFQKVPLKNMDSNIGAAMKNVSKTYGDGKMAVENASIVFKRNYITCLLGRNGAGKSTIIKLLTGQITPTLGMIYWPQNVDSMNGKENRDKIGLCPQSRILIPNLTAKEHLELYASIKLNERQNIEVNKVMKSLNFGKYESFRVENLSGGYQRRLNVAIAFIGSPNLVILDEPCSGVDSKARRNIWDLISMLKQGRAVVLATHYLDEAEHLSDNVFILGDGKIVSENSPERLKEQFTKSFDLHIQLPYMDQNKKTEEIKQIFSQNSIDYSVTAIENQNFIANIQYRSDKNQAINFAPLMHNLESLKIDKKIDNFKVISKDLEGIFNTINKQIEQEIEAKLSNGAEYNNMIFRNESSVPQYTNLSSFDVIKSLLWKRFKHFKRNYRLIVSVLLLPIIFEVTAMALMQLRSPDEYGTELEFSRNLYPNSTEFYSLENEDAINEKAFNNLHCDFECKNFNSSEKAFRWLLGTNNEYIERRYGGISINQSRMAVWYNNKGYHALPVYLNELNTATFRAELNDSEYNIRTVNHPIKLGRKEISASSILQQAADAGIALILLIAFSYVIASCSVYIVNERISGEKLQQKLCGVSFKTYWGVAFIWDLSVYILALLLAVVVLKIFDIPVFTARENMSGVCLLLFMFGLATIPMIHLFEKLFKDASLAAMYILCMNIVTAMTTVVIIILFDVLGESEETKSIRNVLNRLFLVFPQHALADGLIKLCRNYITADMFERFYIDTYKSPITSDLLTANFVALLLFGTIFMVINYIVESNIGYSWLDKVFREKEQSSELQNITSISNGFGKERKYDLYTPTDVLKVSNLKKIYKRKHQAVEDISFQISTGECFGLLGANGAGKSTIFSILSGQLQQTSGTIELFGNKSIAYCPQTNALDNLLTVEEVIQFYATLRKLRDINGITRKTLRSFHLESYRNILVKNLSGGNRRKLSVAVTCFGNTSLVLMDEPTSDMDPVTRSLVYSSINKLISEKRSVILTSHTITEIDRVCHRIAVLKDGKMLSIGTPKMLKALYGNSYLVTIFFDQIEALSIERAVKKDIPELDNLMLHNHCLQFTVKIKSEKSEMCSKSIPGEEDEGILLSELFERLHSFTFDRSISYTVTECLLNQALERILDTECGAYSNLAFNNHSESAA